MPLITSNFLACQCSRPIVDLPASTVRMWRMTHIIDHNKPSTCPCTVFAALLSSAWLARYMITVLQLRGPGSMPCRTGTLSFKYLKKWIRPPGAWHCSHMKLWCFYSPDWQADIKKLVTSFIQSLYYIHYVFKLSYPRLSRVLCVR